MRKNTLILFFIASALISLCDVSGQPQYRGVVWDQPLEQHIAVSDLGRMAQAGITAVRTGVVTDTTLFVVADSLGIQFFQDLPLAYLPAVQYADSVDQYLDKNLPILVDRARRFRSSSTYGLSLKSDTTEELLCDAMTDAAERMTRAAADGGVALYYVTEFLDNDACQSGRVFTLYGRSASERYLSNGSRSRVVGLSVGYRVVHGRRGGWRHLHSEEQQARRLEQTLIRVFDLPSVAALFINRWSDDPTRTSHDGDALGRQFGILGPGGIPGPAFGVVRGMFTGHQLVFAIDAGKPRQITGVWLVILGWILMGSVSVAYGVSPQMRQMAPRYFMSHGFFRESVAEGRAAIPVASLVILFAIAVSAGIIGTVIITHFSETRMVQAFVFSLPGSLQVLAPLFITRPALLCVLIACLYALFMTMWTSLLSIWSNFGSVLLLPWQTLLLVVWPRWPILLVMLAALSVSAGNTSTTAVAIICVATIVTAVSSIYRTINDYRLTAGLSYLKLIIPLLLNPSLLLLTVTTIIVLANRDIAAFMIHLLRLQ
ncbi:MAG: hypothetical protein HKN43_04970 [Rhodothermales bacterium]|nr:hypothetical protein [Rhodothermales bacterium]